MTRDPTTYRDVVPETSREKIVDAVREDARRSATGSVAASVDFGTDNYEKSLTAAVDEALSLNIYNILFKSWWGWRDISKLTADDGPVDGATRIVEVVSHEIAARHEPEVELRIEMVRGGPPVVLTSKIQIATRFRVGAVAVSVRDRRIVGVTGVRVTPSITVSVRDRKISDLKLAPIDFAPFYEAEDADAPAPA